MNFFGDISSFALRCTWDATPDGAPFLGVSICINGKELGDNTDLCPAGVVAYSGGIFLSYTHDRHRNKGKGRESFDFLNETMYGESWRIGMDGHHRARFAVHEVFDISVGDKGWLIFLEDLSGGKSRLTYGTRTAGYMGSHKLDTGYVENVIRELLDCIASRSASTTRH